MKKNTLFSLAAIGLLATIGVTVASASQFGLNKANPPDEATLAANRTQMISDIAQTAGIDSSALKTEIESGRWLPAILQDMNVDLDSFHEKMQETQKIQMQERLSQMVASGSITQEQADARIAQMDNVRNGDMGFGPGHGRAGHGIGFGQRTPPTE